MARNLRFLQRLIPSDPHLWIALAVASIFIVMEILQVFHVLGDHVSLMIGLSVIMICIIMLVADRLKECDQVREDTERLGRLAHSTFDKRIALRSRPDTPEDYDYLWGGYIANYYVYNPSYKVDEDTGTGNTVKILIHRYQHPLFGKAKYIFLTADNEGQKELKTFRLLMQQVKQAYPDVINKVEVKQNKHEAACSAPEMYLGRRHNEPMGVLEVRKPIMCQQHGTPQYYLVIHNEEVVSSYISDHISAWNDANVETVVDFWD